MIKVSVIIPTYNRTDTITDAVQSVLNQTYGSIEIIVIDDGSTDDTFEKISVFSSRITLLRQENLGPSAARNHGVRASTGDIIAFLDSDDTWLPEKIERQVALMERYGKGMVCCICNAYINEDLNGHETDSFRVSGIYTVHNEAVWHNPAEVLSKRFLLFNQVVAVRREAFVSVGGYNRGLSLLEDYDLALRLASLGGPWGIISLPLVIKRNDTRGIGVECCSHPFAHAKALRIALARVFESGMVRHTQMRRNIKRRIQDNACEIRYRELMACGEWLSRAIGALMSVQFRAKRLLSRWSSSRIRLKLEPA